MSDLPTIQFQYRFDRPMASKLVRQYMWHHFGWYGWAIRLQAIGLLLALGFYSSQPFLKGALLTGAAAYSAVLINHYRRYRKAYFAAADRHATEMVICEVSRQGITFRYRHAQGSFDWPRIKRLIILPDFWLLDQQEGAFIPLPVSALNEAARQLIREGIEQANAV
ncbi:YcxB family protein [Parachitinimonas caeni]|uniref:YcxB family protein n=1 Tax=Parachitinimonas caeni TaxID=3031301 RepID=A0ABT7E3S0_9NEIS|nr:YcxB family protein [Parachitinimonas caeni]MDK2125547.1 YcxB family protein [Parachitinimonas caeni]